MHKIFWPLQWILYGVTCAFIFNCLPEWSAMKSPKKEKLWKGLMYIPIMSDIMMLRTTLRQFASHIFYHIAHFWPSLLPNLRRLDLRFQDTLVPFLAWSLMVKLAITVTTMLRWYSQQQWCVVLEEGEPALIEVASCQWEERRDQQPRLGWQWQRRGQSCVGQ